MPSSSLFSITGLSCAYSLEDKDKVLYIDKLEIASGKLVFVLGASGCGKSTLLETLGLMNNTIAGGSVVLHSPDSGNAIDFASLWEKGDQQTLTEVRRKHYSFIFQNTNLMENFTAYENVCLSGMIKQDATQEEVLPRARRLMERIKLTENEVDLETLAINLSGGQRQRLSFVRALNTQAKVLFCDEPTGNLDEANANELFEIIRENIKDGISAIVVSHDINLAVRHADQIILIAKDPAKGYGEVKEENIFHRSQWSVSPEVEKATRDRIRALYSSDTEQNISAAEKGTVDLRSNYKTLFLRKEGRALLGKKSVNLAILSFIMFFTFLAIGFGNGSLNYLHMKMSNAFVNWLTIKIPWENAAAKTLLALQKKLENNQLKDKYLYDNTSLYKEYATQVWRPASTDPGEKKGEFRNLSGRSIDVNGDAKLINEYILADKNIIYGLPTGFKSSNEPAVIVSEKTLKDLNYKDDAKFIYLEYPKRDTTQPGGYRDLKIPVQVRAIVKELPGTYDIIYPIGFIEAMNAANNNFDIESNTKDIHLFYFATAKANNAAQVEKTLRQIIEGIPALKPFSPDLNTLADTQAYAGGTDFDINFSPVLPDYHTVDSFYHLIISDPRLKEYLPHIERIYRYQQITPDLSNVDYDVMSVYFNKLDKVREFADDFSNEANAKNDKVKTEVDTSKVKEKENFSFLSKITSIISFLLIFFSAFAVCLFILNLLKTHLSKVKMNIGTFKAIGLSNREARNIYFYIILFFVCVSLVASFILACIAGYFLDAVLTANMHIEKVNYFKIFDSNTYLTIFIILFSSICSCWYIVNRMLSKTPGDLIYNR